MNKILEIIGHMGQRHNNFGTECVFILVSSVTSYPDKKLITMPTIQPVQL